MVAVLQRRAAAMLAAFALVLGCACAMVATQQQAHAAETTVTAGTTFNAATNLDINNKGYSASNKTEFNARADNNYYKFATSKRESSYKITVLTYEGYRIYGTLYDAGQHRVATFSTKDTAPKQSSRSWVFKNLQRNSVYYIELWRYAVDPEGDGYLESGAVEGIGTLDNVYPAYKVTLKEQAVKPSLSNFTATSSKEHYLNLSWGEPSYNAEKVQIEMWWSWNDNKTVNNTFTRTANASARSYSTKVRYFGSTHPYKVRIRPYLVANGKRVYGSWRYAQTGGSKGYSKTASKKYPGITVTPGKLSNVKVKSKKKAYVNVTWKPPATSGDGVQIELKRNGWGDNKSFTYKSKASTGSYNLKTTHPGQKYKVRLRIYQKMDGNYYYGDWTGWKKVTLKS